MARFFVDPQKIKNGFAFIGGQDAIHIAKVLRLGKGDRVLILDGCGKSYEAVIENTGRDRVVCAITRKLPAEMAAGPRLILVQGMPKGEKMDRIVKKCTELGISRIIPLACERAVVSLEGEKARSRRERWQRIAREASKQCRRPDVPVVDPLSGWDQVLEGLGPAVALIPWEEEGDLTLKHFLCENEPREQVYIFIGPEGGFTSPEVERAFSYGVQPVTLGPRILRTETAGLAVVTMILYQWGDLGGKSNG
ncbi:MAG: Ribosomal RNA small subunit methyltransferase E [Firmicutes bacterium ADurb.Bin456]|nr:MAG: Ribosomal RNA small subunit methyltransferase E [Firmicutes bacterium ADurb.Bin456]